MPDRKARTTPPDGDSARTHKERPDKVLEHQAGPNHRATMEVIPQWLLMPISHAHITRRTLAATLVAVPVAAVEQIAGSATDSRNRQ
jgi:hypothetical protein